MIIQIHSTELECGSEKLIESKKGEAIGLLIPRTFPFERVKVHEREATKKDMLTARFKAL